VDQISKSGVCIRLGSMTSKSRRELEQRLGEGGGEKDLRRLIFAGDEPRRL